MHIIITHIYNMKNTMEERLVLEAGMTNAPDKWHTAYFFLKNAVILNELMDKNDII